MWIPKSLQLHQFRSFEDETFVFQNGKTCLVQGINSTDIGFKSNGAGKSTPQEALRFVLGLPTYAATLSDLIMNGCDSASVCYEMINSKSSEVLSIARTISLKNPTSLEVKINGIDQKDKFSTVPEGDKFILSKIGISSKDLLNYYIISKEKFISFFSSSDNDKKDLINRFSGAFRIDGVESLVEVDVKQLQVELASLVSERDKLIGKKDAYQEDINAEDNEEDQNNTKDFEDKITEYAKDIEDLKNANAFDEKEIQKEHIAIAAIKANVEKFIKDRDAIKLDTLEKEKREIQKELDEANSLKAEIEVALSGVVQCPKCEFEFNPGENIDVEDSRHILAEMTTLIEGIEDRLLKKKGVITKKESDLRKIKQDLAAEEIKQSNKDRQIRALNNNIAMNNKSITSTEGLIESVKKEIEAIKQLTKESKKEELINKVSEVNALIDEYNTTIIPNKETEIYNLSQWVIRFKKFKSHLANKSLSSIQGFSNLYLEKMGTNLGLRLEGYKQLKNGDIREKITPVILRNGMVEGSGSYKKYSGGERCRIDLAPTLACRHLINLSCPSGGLDLFWTDEITEGLDSLGIENLADTVNKLGITSLIVSHVNHDKVFPNIITVEKVNGVSKFI
jgi:DNA repair exonuclease SbcCD ATPase subunit